MNSEFLRTLAERGYIHQQTDAEGLDRQAANGIVTGYIGFDATADSLHVGNLVQIMLLRRLQQTGHRPIVLMGGGTTKVGDPSGRDATRRLLTDAEIDANIAGIREIFGHFLRFDDSPTGAIMANNDDWLSGLEYIPFLRDVGRHFSINRMLTMDSVRLRLERAQPLTFLEFNYMILQGYDFVELNARHDCTLQMGGSDQWGNILQGVELGRRVRERELYGLTSPLITTASGAKMGKTATGAVWLNAKRRSAYDYWQYWRNTEDGDVGRFLRLFTDLPLDEIARLEKLEGAEINEAKKILAKEATRLCHGDAAEREASATAARAFSGTAAAAEALDGVDAAGTAAGRAFTGTEPASGARAGVVAQGSAGLPTLILAAGAALPIIEAVVGLGMASSKSDARRLIEQGGVKLNDRPVQSVKATVSGADLGEHGTARLAVGKKRHGLIKRSLS